MAVAKPNITFKGSNMSSKAGTAVEANVICPTSEKISESF